MRTLLVAAGLMAVSTMVHAQRTIPAPPDVAAVPATATKTTTGLASRVEKKGTGTTRPGRSDLSDPRLDQAPNKRGWHGFGQRESNRPLRHLVPL